ncbi:tyrosine-type recombinase/integrase [Flagellimonas meridianipacifica]|uniref:Tyrosine recombinase XerC n=1 Tax=Flagellimonas meridianipacifica TaxID=1080225 RepID=A0A2T0M6P9_9FLAO|nr:tyrosine-type recombinase/integrase [Allomuricauda pacifica]PRX53138.1 integrase/recombinase XerC [Allomuricauda pacifica]
MSVHAFVEYLKLEKNYSKHTILAYEKDLKVFNHFCSDEFDVQDIDKIPYSFIRSWIVHLADSGLTNRSINRKISSLNAYYKFLQKTGQITSSPLVKHKALKTKKKVEVPFSEIEMDKVLTLIPFNDDFEGLRDRLMIEMLYATGIRRTELVNLKLRDVDWAKKVIKVLGKRNKERILPLLPKVMSLMDHYVDERSKLEKVQDDTYLFLTQGGLKIYETLVYRTINKYFSLVSPKVKRSPHVLRHTFATHLLNQGADLNAVKELLGHASLASTQVYTHNSIAELKKAHLKAHPRNKK